MLLAINQSIQILPALRSGKREADVARPRANQRPASQKDSSGEGPQRWLGHCERQDWREATLSKIPKHFMIRVQTDETVPSPPKDWRNHRFSSLRLPQPAHENQQWQHDDVMKSDTWLPMCRDSPA
mmetsp:Transcript_23613/g.93276  ORF Transcript_23613/g.93276 Transcript_23613/m.93276 type:complete len:126 (-) Transcript_23613:29-406(-)